MPESQDTESLILWVDLETTGLDARIDSAYVLEVSAVLTDDSLEVVDSLTRVMHFDNDQVRLLLDPVVQDMHAANYLWEECKQSPHNVSDTQWDIIQMMRDNGVMPKVAPLGGSTINFDREWLEVFLPALFEFLHYRNIDVSTLKTLTKRWRPDLARILPESNGIHRAESDIMGTIELMKFFREHLFEEGRPFPHDNK